MAKFNPDDEEIFNQQTQTKIEEKKEEKFINPIHNPKFNQTNIPSLSKKNLDNIKDVIIKKNNYEKFKQKSFNSFDLENYESVKERKKRFYKDFPDGRIIVTLLNINSILEYALFFCQIYKNSEDQKNSLPVSTGYSNELRELTLRRSREGKEYEGVNFSSWVENCEESAVGRALDNAGYSSNNKCSKEEILKVNNPINNNFSSNNSNLKELITDQTKINLKNAIKIIKSYIHQSDKEILKELSLFKNKDKIIFIESLDDNKLSEKWAIGILNKANKKIEELSKNNINPFSSFDDSSKIMNGIPF